jgi:hypothetical protein
MQFEICNKDNILDTPFPHLCLFLRIAEPEVFPALFRIAVSLLTEIILAAVYRNSIRFAKSRNAIGP